MKRLFFLLTTFFTLNSYGQIIDTLSIYSNSLKEYRKIMVYTPLKYDYSPKQRFEVIYVLDAQAREMFDMVHSTVAFKNYDICPMIVVGIVSNDRNKDFLPVNEQKETFNKYYGHLGNADLFLKFIQDELIPYMDNHYRTLPKRIAIGHSNGGTLIGYSFLKNPNLFDAYLAISPNFAYDNSQLVRGFQNLNPELIQSEKFFYTCNSGGSPEEGDWVVARKKVLEILQTRDFKGNLVFKNDDFSSTENHYSVFQIGVLNGLKEYFNYQFLNADKLLNYYDNLSSIKIQEFNPQDLNSIGYDFYYSLGKPKDALKILIWANKKFPKDINLYDSIGEMYQNLKMYEEAKKQYLLLDKKIEEFKPSLKDSEYLQLKKGVMDRLESLKSKK